MEKFELFKLGENPELLPIINRDLKVTTLQNIGKKITDQFKRYSLQIKPYDLRHDLAVRTIFYDLPDTVAARMMGHSVSLHTQTCLLYTSPSPRDLKLSRMPSSA